LIEVFVEEPSPGKVRITDLGETFRHLHSQGFDVDASAKRKFLVETIASRVEVEVSRGRLSKVGPTKKAGDILMDVLVVISDLYTRLERMSLRFH
jgi:hypothetical protein